MITFVLLQLISILRNNTYLDVSRMGERVYLIGIVLLIFQK